jgi:5-hydroxyisourate hydrolase
MVHNNDQGRLTTHVLDTALGRPACGIKIELFRLTGTTREAVTSAITNDDGRCDAPLLNGVDMIPGDYELVFHAGNYLKAAFSELTGILFLDQIPIRFGIASTDQHYHVPLLLSPFGYSTYKGS